MRRFTLRWRFCTQHDGDETRAGQRRFLSELSVEQYSELRVGLFQATIRSPLE